MGSVDWASAREQLVHLVDDEAAAEAVVGSVDLRTPVGFAEHRVRHLWHVGRVATMAHGWGPMTGRARVEEERRREVTKADGAASNALRARCGAWASFTGQELGVWPGLRDERRDVLAELFKDADLRKEAAVFDADAALREEVELALGGLTAVLYWLKHDKKGARKNWLKVGRRLEADVERFGGQVVEDEDDMDWASV